MPPGAAGAPAWFVSVMRLVTAGLNNILMYLDAIGPDDCPLHHVAILATFFVRLRLHKLKLSPDKSRIGAARADFLSHFILADGVRPNDARVAALARMPMPTNINQLRSLLGGLSYYRKFLANMAHHIRPITTLLKKGAAIDFTSAMEDTVRALLAELAALPILVFPDWDAVMTRFGPSASIATPVPLASEPPSNKNSRMAPYVPSSISAEPPTTMSRTGPLWNSKPDASCGVLDASDAIYSVCTSSFSPTISASIKFARSERPNRAFNTGWNSAYNFRLSYRRGQENANADFLSRLPFPPIADDVSGASALTDPDDLGVYLIRACGLTTPSCPVPGVGLGGLVPSPDIPVFGGLAPSPDIPVLGGLPLTSDDFRTHRALIPSPSATIRPRRPRATLPQAPYAIYAINARDDAPGPTRRTRSQTAILDGNTRSGPDYRTAAHSGFAASAAAASPPLRTSPPPRSARLGSTTSPGRCAPITSTPPPADLPSVPPPLSAPLHPTAPDLDVQAAAAHLSNSLLNYSHSD